MGTDGHHAERLYFAAAILTAIAEGACARWASVRVADRDVDDDPDPAASPHRVVLAEAGVDCHGGGIGAVDIERALHAINTHAVAGLAPALRGQLLRAWFRYDADAVTPEMADVVAQILTFGEVVHQPG